MESRSLAYTIVDSALGPLLVTTSERGVCHVRFGDHEDELAEALRAELPCARVVRRDPAVKPWAEAIARYVDGRTARLEVPLDVAGSRFQRRVWDALRRIPLGETRAYGELAAKLGSPQGARAVARACATNPVAVVVPCHRVIGRDGSLAGYAYGIERKRALLRTEGALEPEPR